MLNGEELIRLVDSIHRDKDIGKEVLFEALETALLTAVRKRYGERPELAIEIERQTGEIIAWDGEEEAVDVDIGELGRIAAQTAKQVMIQKIRDAERDVVYGEYEDKVNDIVTGTVQRIEGGNIIVNLGRTEGIIPRHEKVRSENYNPGDRVKAIIYDVKKVGPRVKIMLSRADPEIVKKLFELEVPEIAERIIEIRSIAREAGFRTKIAVHSIDSRVDCIGACVGIRGTRIKSITDELNGEKIDIIRWSDSIEELILNALRPAQISDIELSEDPDDGRKIARVLVPDDQLSLAIGRKGQNVRLASRLTGHDIQIQSPSQAAESERSADGEDQTVERAREALFGAGDGAAAAEAASEAPTSDTDATPEAEADAETSSTDAAPTESTDTTTTDTTTAETTTETVAPAADDPAAPATAAEETAPPATGSEPETKTEDAGAAMDAAPETPAKPETTGAADAADASTSDDDRV